MAASRKPKTDEIELVEPADQLAELTELTEPDVPAEPEAPEVPLAEQVDDKPAVDPGPMHPGFVRIYHHESGGAGEVPEDLVPFHAAKGWTTDPNPPTTDDQTQEA